VKIMNINGKTQLIGLLGWPVSHSFSPAMHNAAAEAAGLNWAYVPLPVRPDLVETAVRGLPALGFRGVNVTIPHKQAVMPVLNKIEAGAQAIGAVNTIKIELEANEPFLTGFNTDWSGFLADLVQLNVTVKGRECLVLGAGGSARAIVFGLAKAEAKRITLLSRRVEQATELINSIAPFCPANILHQSPLSKLPEVSQSCQAPIIINTTPLGMTPNAESSIWPESLPFPTGSFVYDLVYNPQQTRLMNQAQSAGCRTANGLGMLIWQGAKAFEIWTGIMPDVAVMRQSCGL
ncbi:MAG: shikimate dehydrogenase, partial [Chloroflexota bacterium]